MFGKLKFKLMTQEIKDDNDKSYYSIKIDNIRGLFKKNKELNDTSSILDSLDDIIYGSVPLEIVGNILGIPKHRIKYVIESTKHDLLILPLGQTGLDMSFVCEKTEEEALSVGHEIIQKMIDM